MTNYQNQLVVQDHRVWIVRLVYSMKNLEQEAGHKPNEAPVDYNLCLPLQYLATPDAEGVHNQPPKVHTWLKSQFLNLHILPLNSVSNILSDRVLAFFTINVITLLGG